MQNKSPLSNEVTFNKSKLRYYFIGSLLPICILFLSFYFVYLSNLKKEQQNTISLLSANLLSERKQLLKSSVLQVITMTDNTRKYFLGLGLDPEQAERQTSELLRPIIRDIRIGKENNYIWVNKVLNYEGGDNFAIVVVNPNQAMPEGSYLTTNYRDAEGNTPFKTELDGINKDGELYFDYYIEKLAEDKASEKLSFAKLYKPFNWIIASGIYIDDMNQMIANEKAKLEQIYIKQKQLSLFASVVSSVIVMFIALNAAKNIRRLIQNYESRIQQHTDNLKKLSTTDQLTGLYNRLYLDNTFKTELEKCKRYKRQFSIVLADIDHFKSINDTFGHQVGDQVLTEFSAILQQHVRRTDTVGRWGGEEFLIICPETDLDGAAAFAENLRLLINLYEFTDAGEQTCSFGVTSFLPEDSEEQMTARADKALYKAKELGRNKVFTCKDL